jgi:acyl-CoA synthetase (AMP-forming)/AMP-acid ligase II
MFVLDDGSEVAWSDVFARSVHLSQRLERGAKVAVLTLNDWRAFAVVLATWRQGGTYVPVSTTHLQASAIDVLRDTGSTSLFYHPAFAGWVDGIRAACPELTLVESLDAVEPAEAAADAVAIAASHTEPLPSDAAVAIFSTGGTTGRSKGVVHGARTWHQMLDVGLQLMRSGRRPVCLLAAPLSHAAGLLAWNLMPAGSTTVVLPKFDAAAVVDAIARHRVTHAFLPPTALYALLAHPAIDPDALESLEFLAIGGGPISPAKLREAVERLGPRICQIYGQVECPQFIGFMSPVDTAQAALRPELRHRLRACGRPGPGLTVRITGDDGRERELGEAGEVCVRGALVMEGYHRNPEATRRTVDGDGWLHTGDIGYLDSDGFLYLVDRKTDMIITGGYNVYSVEVENALNAHPAVLASAVYGAPDPKWGEAVHATVEFKPGMSIGVDELRDFVKLKVGSVKTPKVIEIAAALPRSPVGKILKRELRDRLWVGRDRAIA